MDRREFVAAGAYGFASLLAGSSVASPAPLIPTIGLQLYTVRDLARADLDRTLGKVAAAGYREVEFAGYHGHSAKEVRAMLDKHGLTAPAAHVGASDLERDLAATLDNAEAVGHAYVILSWIDEKDRTDAGYRRVAKLVNEAASRSRSRGIRIGYHNNKYEFVPLAGGLTGYEVLLAECPAESLDLEMDIFWMRAAGQNPLSWFSRASGRYRLVHVKDMGPAGEMLDVGKGVIDWRTTLTAAKNAGVTHFFVEHDEPGDAMRSIATSFRSLSRLRG
jgi:sugar phosphate isomerase/epimerase